MKLSKVIALLNIVVAHCFILKVQESSVSIGFEGIIKSVLKENATLTIGNLAKDKGIFDMVLLEPLRELNVKCNILNKEPKAVKGVGDWLQAYIFDVEETTILIFDSIRKLTAFNNKTHPADSYIKGLNIYIYCHKATFNDILTLGEINRRRKKLRLRGGLNIVDDMNEIIHNEYFLVDETKSIKLLTYIWNTEDECDEPKLIEINQFDKNTNRWKNSNFFIEKFKDFLGCELVFGIFKSYPEFQFKIISNETVNFSGYGVKMIGLLSEVLNFKYRLNPAVGAQIFGGKYHFKNLTPDLQVYFVSDVSALITSPLRFSEISINVPTVEYFAVPPGTPYDGYEKLYLPFDLDTWIWTLIVFVVAFATIFIVYQMDKDVQDFVFGRNVSTPSMNVIAAFCGISQVVMPTRNFARFLVMSFILYSFMIRNLYQGMMCDSLQSDMRGPKPVTSMLDVNKAGYEYIFDGRYESNQINSFRLNELMKG
jgi:hypothetical protein